MSILVNERSLKDAALKTTKALPAADANNDTDALYIGADGPHRERLKLRVSWPANNVLVADKTVTLTLKSGAASNSLAAETDPAQTYVITGDTGFAAGSVDFDLAKCGTYVAVNQAVLAAGGDNTGTTFTYEVVS